MMMEKADLQNYLDFTLSNQDVTMPKPNPEDLPDSDKMIWFRTARMSGSRR